MKKCYVVLSFLLMTLFSSAQDVFLEILQNELDRQKVAFAEMNPSPYYFSFKVDEVVTNDVQADFGSLVLTDENFSRIGNVSVRIGDYEKDNTALANGYNFRMDFTPLPIDDEANGINFMLWVMSDLKYKVAQASFNSLSSSQNLTKGRSFTKEEKVTYFEERLDEGDYEFDQSSWEQVLKEVSAIANNEAHITNSSVTLSRRITRKYFVDSEGTSIVQNHQNCLLSIVLELVDKNGLQLPLTETYSARTLNQLPEKDELLAVMNNLVSQARYLVDAPYVEPYSGPVLFSGAASAVFFHEVLGHRIEAERLTQISDGQTFVNKLDSRILPKGFSVRSLPSVDEFRGFQLTGGYKYDDQGVAAEDVTIIEAGVLKNFLMSRKPLGKLQKSNGHGRSAEGGTPVSRQSNLIVESDKGLASEKLRAQLIKECKKQGKPFGYYIAEVEGGFTTTDRYQPNTINISPIIVYKVFVDGRENQLVKGMNLVGTPLNAFSEIIASGTEYEAFNGYCGAESGYIPVSAVSPPLLLKKLEVQRKPVLKTKLPILPPPSKGI